MKHIKEILDKAKAGDTKAINQFIESHSQLNKYIIDKIVRTNNCPFNFEELESVGMMAIYKSIETYDESRGTIKNHIAYAIRSEVKNFLSGNSFVVKVDKRTSPKQEYTDIINDDKYEIDDTYENNDNRAHLRDVLDKHMSKLTLREIKVLKGLYFDDLSYREIAENMTIPLSSVYSVEKGALAKLKKLMNP